MSHLAYAYPFVTWSFAAALLFSGCNPAEGSTPRDVDTGVVSHQPVDADAGTHEVDSSRSTSDAALDGEPDGSRGPSDAALGDSALDGQQTEGGSIDPDAAPGDAAEPDVPRTEQQVGPEIAADCSAEVSDELQAILDALQPGSTLQFPEDGCFLTDRPITLREREDIVIEGHGATLMRTTLSPQVVRYPRHNGHFAVEDVAEVLVRDLAVVGTNIGHDHGGAVLDARGDEHSIDCVGEGFGCYCVAFEFEHAFAVRDSEHVTLDSLRADAVWGDGVYLERSDDVVVHDVEVDRNGRQGMAVISGQRIVIDGARVLHSRRGGVDLEPNTARDRIASIEIKHSEIRSHLLAFPGAGGGEVSDVYIHHNTILRSGVPWVYSRGKADLKRVRWRVEDNVVLSTLSSPQPGAAFEHTREVSVRRNVVPFKSDREMAAVGLAFGSEALIECNHFPGAARVYDADDTSAGMLSDNSLSAMPKDCLSTSRGQTQRPQRRKR